MRQQGGRDVGGAGQRVPVVVPKAVKRSVVRATAQQRRLVGGQEDGLVRRLRQAVGHTRLAQAVAGCHHDQPVLVGVFGAAVGNLLGQHADGGVGLADDGVVVGAKAAVGRGAFGCAELRNNHVIAFRDAVTRLRGDAVVNARAIGQGLQVAGVAVAADQAGQQGRIEGARRARLGVRRLDALEQAGRLHRLARRVGAHAVHVRPLAGQQGGPAWRGQRGLLGDVARNAARPGARGRQLADVGQRLVRHALTHGVIRQAVNADEQDLVDRRRGRLGHGRLRGRRRFGAVIIVITAPTARQCAGGQHHGAPSSPIHCFHASLLVS
ncbi:hypothetical protein D3C72_1313070 [compost metagenome]